jgi:hypothetical protein
MKKPIKKYFLGGLLKKIVPIAAGALGNVVLPFVGGSIASGLASKLMGGSGSNGAEQATPSISGEVANTSEDSSILGKIRELLNPQRVQATQGLALGGSMKRKGSMGSDVEFSGPSHETGGIDLPQFGAEVEGGETAHVFKNGKLVNKRGETPYVFSNRLKVPGTNMTFAKAHKATKRRGGGEADLNELADKQEFVSGRATSVTPRVLERYATGGNLLSPRVLERYGFGGILDTIGESFKGDGIGNKILGGLGKALPYASAIANIAMGMQSPDAGPAPTGPNLIDRGALKGLQSMGTRFNANPALQENRRGFSNLLADRGASDATKLAALAGTQQNVEGILVDKENKEQALKNDKQTKIASMVAGFDQADTRAKDIYTNRLDRYNENILAAKSAGKRMVGAGFEQAFGILQQQMAEGRARGTERHNLAVATSGMPEAARNKFMRHMADSSTGRWKKLYESMISKGATEQEAAEAVNKAADSDTVDRSSTFGNN